MNDTAKPLITTIIPTYRRPKLLRRSIRSVLSQTYPHFQVCVYDNASGDETASIVAELSREDPRVKYHCHAENIGAIRNFNYGMKHVNTPFFSFLSDDDILLPEFFENALEGFVKYPDALFSAGSVISMTEKGKVLLSQLSLWPRDGYYSPPEGLFNMMGMKHPTWTGVLFRKEIAQKIGALDQNVGILADMDFELRIAAVFPFVISRKPCAIFVHHPSSSCSLMDLHSFWPGWLKIIRNLKEDQRIPLEVRTYVEQKLTDLLKRNLFGTGFIIKKNFKDAYKAADILRNHYNQKTKAAIIYGTAKLCEYIPLVYYLFCYRNRIRKLFKKIKVRDLQRQFGDYARFLDFN